MAVSSAYKKGDTWEGAVENLKNGWVPMIVRSGESVPEGNRWVIDEGAIALTADQLESSPSVREWLKGLDAEDREKGGTADKPSRALFPSRISLPV